MGYITGTQITLDDAGFSAITVPVPCRKMTIREVATQIAPTAYYIAGPLSTSGPSPRYPGESTTFLSAQPGNVNASFQGGERVAYGKSSSGTITFSVDCES